MLIPCQKDVVRTILPQSGSFSFSPVAGVECSCTSFMAVGGFFDLVAKSGSILVELASEVENDTATAGVFFKAECTFSEDTIFPLGSDGCSITNTLTDVRAGDAIYLSYGTIGSEPINTVQVLRTRYQDNFFLDLSIWQPGRETEATACLQFLDHPYGPVYTFPAGSGWWPAGAVRPAIKKGFVTVTAVPATVSITNPFTGAQQTFSQSTAPSITDRRFRNVGNQNLRLALRSINTSLGTNDPYSGDDLYGLNSLPLVCKCRVPLRLSVADQADYGGGVARINAAIIPRGSTSKLDREGFHSRSGFFFTYDNANSDHVPGMPQLDNGLMFNAEGLQLETFGGALPGLNGDITLSDEPADFPILLSPSGMAKGQFKSDVVVQSLDTGYTNIDPDFNWTYEAASVETVLGVESVAIPNGSYVVYYLISSSSIQNYGPYDLDAMDANLIAILAKMDQGGDQFGNYPWDYNPSTWWQTGDITLQQIFPQGGTNGFNTPFLSQSRPTYIGPDGRTTTRRRYYTRHQQVFGNLYYKITSPAIEQIAAGEFTEEQILASTATDGLKQDLLDGKSIYFAYGKNTAVPQFLVDVIVTDTEREERYPLRRPIASEPDLVIAYNTNGTIRQAFYGYRFADGPIPSDGAVTETKNEITAGDYELQQTVDLNSPGTFPAGSTIGLSLPT